MSLKWVESMRPLTDEGCVVAALQSLGVAHEITAEEIRATVEGCEVSLRRQAGAWILRRLTTEAHRAFEGRLEAAYAEAQTGRRALLDDVRRRRDELAQEESRRRLVQERGAAIEEKARALGYSVQRERVGEEVRLVLVRRRS